MSDASAPSPPPSGPPVNERVAALVNDVIKASGADAEHLAERLRTEAGRWRSKETVVVVAAEPNRGKSSLLNALLGEDLLPSGSRTPTGAHIVIRHGPQRTASVIRDGGMPEPVAWTDVASLAVAPPSAGIEGLIVELPHPLLETGLVLVDTPGVGGLHAAHGRITMAALSKADALVFLLDPGEPVSRPELSFLASAADRIDRVLFALVRTDRSPAWRTIADDDRQLIARHAPRFDGAPLVPTSARLALAARSQEPVDDQLLAESGVPALIDTLQQGVVGRVAAVRLANLLRLTATVLDALQAPARAAAEAAEGAPEAQEVATRLQARQDELRDASERLQIDVTDRFNAIRDLANAEFTRLMRELATRFDGQHGDAHATTDEVIASLQAEVRAGCAELTERLDSEVAALHADIVAVVGEIDVDLTSLQLGADLLAPAASPDAGGTDPMGSFRLVTSLASGGTGIAMSSNYWAAGNQVLGVMMGAGAILSLTMAAVNMKVMRRQRDIATLRRQVSGALDGARSEVSTALRQQLLTVQRELERAMKATIRQQARDLQAQISEATQLARSDAAARQSAKAEAQRRLAALEPLHQRAGGLQAEVTALLSSPG